MDASPEMLAIAAARVGDERARFIQADLFTWAPDRRYDVVFIGFWLSHVLASRTVADWLDRLRRAGVPAGELKTLDRVYDSEQARAEGLVWEVDHSRLGAIRLPGNPVHYSRSAVAPGLPPPTLGEHTDEVRAALLGPAPVDRAPVQADGN